MLLHLQLIQKRVFGPLRDSLILKTVELVKIDEIEVVWVLGLYLVAEIFLINSRFFSRILHRKL